MPNPSSHRITGLLEAWSKGDDAALAALTPLVHAELRTLARAYMSHERRDHMLQVTGLVNECYLRLVDAQQVRWQNRAHFFALSARLMRRILVDFARSRRYGKRGGEAQHVTLGGRESSPVETSWRSTTRYGRSRPSTSERAASSRCGSSAG